VVAIFAVACAGHFPQSALHPESDFARELDGLTLSVFWWALGVFMVVEGILIAVLIRFREEPGAKPIQRQRGNTFLEIAWTALPTAILVVIAVPTMRDIFDTYHVPDGALRIEAVGHQWWWEYRYPDLGVSAANELHLPVGRTVGITLTSADVIHSFWIPGLGGKRDMVAGRHSQIWLTPSHAGIYPGQCAEFCGLSHANMRINAVVEDSAAFAQWATHQRDSARMSDTAESALRLGYQQFTKVRDPGTNTCIVCHTIAGISGGAIGPDLTHLATRATIAGGMLPNTVEGLTRWLRDPSAVKPGSRMPTIPMSDSERTALVTYLQSLK
jgi:cytochrome c oxidase subunit 2